MRLSPYLRSAKLLAKICRGLRFQVAAHRRPLRLVSTEAASGARLFNRRFGYKTRIAAAFGRRVSEQNEAQKLRATAAAANRMLFGLQSAARKERRRSVGERASERANER